MRTALLLLAVSLGAGTVEAQGTIRGCVTDGNGGVIPGVDVAASSASTRQKVVTNTSGCYEFKSLPDGTYSVTANLMGFVPGKREGVTVATGQSVDRLDFALCLAAGQEIDWPVPNSLDEAWKLAAVVAHVRIAATVPFRSDCQSEGSLHTATVIEIFKGDVNERTEETLTFRQERWVSEQTPYSVGQEMIVFLAGGPQAYLRLAGPYYVFLLKGSKITSFHSPVKTDGMTLVEFLSKLRAIGKGPEA
jgi:hypothetical protein